MSIDWDEINKYIRKQRVTIVEKINQQRMDWLWYLSNVKAEGKAGLDQNGPKMLVEKDLKEED